MGAGMGVGLQRRLEVYQRGLRLAEGEYRLTPAQARRVKKLVNRARGRLEQMERGR